MSSRVSTNGVIEQNLDLITARILNLLAITDLSDHESQSVKIGLMRLINNFYDSAAIMIREAESRTLNESIQGKLFDV